MKHRNPVSKSRSAGAFRATTSRTKSVNIPRMVMRGGWRM